MRGYDIKHNGLESIDNGFRNDFVGNIVEVNGYKVSNPFRIIDFGNKSYQSFVKLFEKVARFEKR